MTLYGVDYITESGVSTVYEDEDFAKEELINHEMKFALVHIVDLDSLIDEIEALSIEVDTIDQHGFVQDYAYIREIEFVV